MARNALIVLLLVVFGAVALSACGGDSEAATPESVAESFCSDVAKALDKPESERLDAVMKAIERIDKAVEEDKIDEEALANAILAKCPEEFAAAAMTGG